MNPSSRLALYCSSILLLLVLSPSPARAKTLNFNRERGIWETGQQGGFDGVWEDGDSAVFLARFGSYPEFLSDIKANVVTVAETPLVLGSSFDAQHTLQVNKFELGEDKAILVSSAVTLDLRGVGAVSSGSIEFLDGTSTLLLNSASAITGGVQTFAKTGNTVRAMATQALDGGHLSIGSNSVLSIEADQATTRNAWVVLEFGNQQNGSTIELNGHSTTFGYIESTAGMGVIRNSGTTAATLTLHPDSGSTAFDGQISDAGGAPLSVVKEGNGTTMLTNPFSDYRGDTIVRSGTLIGRTSLLRDLHLDGGTFQTHGGGGEFRGMVVTAAGGTFNSSGYNLSTRSLFADGAFIKTGAGELGLSGTLANYASGDLNIAGGTLRIFPEAHLTVGTEITRNVTGHLVNDGTLTINNASISGTVSGTGRAEVIGSLRIQSGTFGAGTIHIDNATLSAAAERLVIAGNTILDGNVTLSNNLTFTGSSRLASDVEIISTNETSSTSGVTMFSGEISGSGRLGYRGDSRQNSLVLSGNNTFTGGIDLADGVMELQNAGALGSTGDFLLRGGTLRFSSANRVDYSDRFLPNTAMIYSIDTNGQAVTFGTRLFGNKLTKMGAGTLTLVAANNLSNGTTLLGGTIGIANNDALGSGEVLVKNGAIRAVDTARFINNQIILDGTLEVGRVTHFLGNVTLASDSIISTNNPDAADAASIFNGVISGTHSLTIREGLGGIGTGAIVFGGSNTYHGDTRLQSGRLSISHDYNLGNANGSLVFDGGTLKITQGLSLSRIVSVISSGTFETQSFDSSIQTLTGSGNLTRIGSGRLTLTGHGSVYTGTLNFQQGSFRIIESSALQIGNGGAGGALVGDVINDGMLTFDRSDMSTHGSVISGSGAVVKDGAGTLTITASNSYLGGTTVRAGTLGLAPGASLGNGALTIEGGGIRAAGGPFTVNNSVNLAGNFTLGRLTEFAGPTTLQADVTVTSANPDVSAPTTSSFSGVISGAHRLTFAEGSNGTGTIVLSGSNTYNGGTTVRGGTIAAANNHAMGGGAVTVEGGTFLVGNGVSVDNQVHLQGGAYDRDLAGSANLKDAVNARSSFAGGKPDTTAQILQGTLTTGARLETSFANTSGALNDNIRLSDVYSFHGTNSDIFVLQLSMTSVDANSFLGWLNTATNQWINAVEGNTGENHILFIEGAYDGNLVLGHYGIDTATGSVWAVINHNSDFAAVVPEPGTATLLVLAGAACLSIRRFRSPRQVRL